MWENCLHIKQWLRGDQWGVTDVWNLFTNKDSGWGVIDGGWQMFVEMSEKSDEYLSVT